MKAARGLALIAVLWTVAALAVLVSGLVRAQRDEVRIAATQRQLVEGGALGNAAIQLALQEAAARPLGVTSLERRMVSFEGHDIGVEVVPVSGLVDLNRAPERLLARLFEIGGGAAPERAAALASQVVAARQPAAGRAGTARFAASEDLLQLPGFDYDLYARLAPLVTSEGTGSGRVHPLAAPEGVLLVLAEGRADVAARIGAARDAGQVGIDTTALAGDFVDASAAVTRYRLQARVALADGRQVLSTRMIDMAPSGRRGGPWRVYQSDDRIASPGGMR